MKSKCDIEKRTEVLAGSGEAHTVEIPTRIPNGKSQEDFRQKHLRERGLNSLREWGKINRAGVEQVHRGHKAIIDQNPAVSVFATIQYLNRVDRAGRTIFEFERFEICEKLKSGAMGGMFTSPNARLDEARLEQVNLALTEMAAENAARIDCAFGQIFALRIDHDDADVELSRIIAQNRHLNFDNRQSKLIEEEVYARYPELDIAVPHADNLFLTVGLADSDDLKRYTKRSLSSKWYEEVIARRDSTSLQQRIGAKIGVDPSLVGRVIEAPRGAMSIAVQLPRAMGGVTRAFLNGLMGVPELGTDQNN